MRLASGALEACGHRPQLVTSGGGVDANVLNDRGIPTVNLGNGMRDIHTSDESIAVRDLEAMLGVALATVTLAARASATGARRTAGRSR